MLYESKEMNVLITGSNGYIGKSIFNSKVENVKFFHGNRQTINLFDKESIKSFIKENKIDYLIAIYFLFYINTIYYNIWHPKRNSRRNYKT